MTIFPDHASCKTCIIMSVVLHFSIFSPFRYTHPFLNISHGRLITYFQFFFTKIDHNKNKQNAELQQTDPSTKVKGEFSTRSLIYPHNAQNGFLLFPHFSFKKTLN